MKFSLTSFASSALLLASAISPVTAAYKGFNLGGNNAQGGCKTVGDYKGDFAKIRSWPGGFNAVRLFASSDCGTLANAVPACFNAQGQVTMKILVGVWALDDAHFEREKAALLDVMRRYGTGWMAGVSVGSEDLYRKDIDPNRLAGKIYDVRGMVQTIDKAHRVPIGHTDTWTAWVDHANDVVTRACDFVITDGYPYWQSKSVNAGHYYFYKSISDVKNHIKYIKNVPVWVGETGWPTAGPSQGPAAPSTYNLQKYWKTVACQMLRENQDFFWFAAFDAPTATPDVEKHFGVAYSGRSLKINLAC